MEDSVSNVQAIGERRYCMGSVSPECTITEVHVWAKYRLYHVIDSLYAYYQRKSMYTVFYVTNNVSFV